MEKVQEVQEELLKNIEKAGQEITAALEEAGEGDPTGTIVAKLAEMIHGFALNVIVLQSAIFEQAGQIRQLTDILQDHEARLSGKVEEDTPSSPVTPFS